MAAGMLALSAQARAAEIMADEELSAVRAEVRVRPVPADLTTVPWRHQAPVVERRTEAERQALEVAMRPSWPQPEDVDLDAARRWLYSLVEDGREGFSFPVGLPAFSAGPVVLSAPFNSQGEVRLFFFFPAGAQDAGYGQFHQ